MTIDSADDSKISNRTINTNRISNRTYDSKSNRITKLRRSLILSDSVSRSSSWHEISEQLHAVRPSQMLLSTQLYVIVMIRCKAAIATDSPPINHCMRVLWCRVLRMSSCANSNSISSSLHTVVVGCKWHPNQASGKPNYDQQESH